MWAAGWRGSGGRSQRWIDIGRRQISCMGTESSSARMKKLPAVERREIASFKLMARTGTGPGGAVGGTESSSSSGLGLSDRPRSMDWEPPQRHTRLMRLEKLWLEHLSVSVATWSCDPVDELPKPAAAVPRITVRFRDCIPRNCAPFQTCSADAVSWRSNHPSDSQHIQKSSPISPRSHGNANLRRPAPPPSFSGLPSSPASGRV